MDFETLTPCGESCAGCKKREAKKCRGCIESGGHCEEWRESNGCPIFLCAQRHNVKFCGICPEFPCEFLVRKVTWRKDVVGDLRELAKKYGRKL